MQKFGINFTELYRNDFRIYLNKRKSDAFKA